MFSRVVRPLFSRQLTTSVRRFFDLHEYQSKDLMRKYGVLVQRGDIATTPEQAYQVAKDLNVKDGDLILKAQVHAGGRGKGTSSFTQEPSAADSRAVSRSSRPPSR
jgi:succinyl-CoA synthetase beta subunit